MARDFSNDFKAALEASVLRPRILIELEMASYWLRYWTGIGDLVWNGNTYTNGYYQGVSPYKETGNVSAEGVSIKLAGEPSAMISIILNDVRPWKIGRARLALLDADANVIADPEIIFEGKLDKSEIQDDLDSSVVTLSYESRLIAMDRVKEFRYNHATQQIFYPGDKGFEYMEQMKSWAGFWGKHEKPKTANDSKKKKSSRSSS